jgi:sugar/nucleoside kinase (ribokinase family)
MVSAATETPAVLVVGGVGIDTIVRVPSLQLPAVDSIHVEPVRDYVAHTGNGVALGLLALGHRTRLVDFIGADPQAALIHARYRERGLDFRYIEHESGTRRSVNLVDPEGRRLSLYDGRHPDSLRMPRAFYLPLLQAATHVHLSIMPWARELYDDCQALGLLVSTDLHDWDGENSYYHDFAYRSDLVFLSAAALGERRDAVMRSILERGRAQAVVATDGARGSYLLARADGVVRHTPCAALDQPVVDCNGAGDAFASGFLHGLFQGKPLEACMQLGALAGAYACRSHGTAEQSLTADMLAALRFRPVV